MINIIVNQQTQKVEIESRNFNVNTIDLIPLIKHILDKAYYSGEKLCLEEIDYVGNYREVERW